MNLFGRMNRKDYWLWTIIIAVITVIINSSMDTLRTDNPEENRIITILFMLYFVGVGILQIALTARRLHDTNRTGWLALLHLIPCLGSLILFFFLIEAGHVGKNEYGPDPSEIG